MRVVHLKNTGAPLVVFFAGWGMDETPFADFDPGPGLDLAVCFGYCSEGFRPLLKLNQRPETVATIRRVVAWSFGVSVASALIQQCPALANAPERVAINGTTTPVDDKFGIPRAAFDATLANFSETALAKFERRMCGGAANLAFYQSRRPKRSLESLRAELSDFPNFQIPKFPNSAFTQAFVGTHDKIFPPRNQQAAWAETSTPVAIAAAPHYSDALLRKAVCG